MASWRRVCLRVSLCAASALVTAPAGAADIYVAAGASLQAAIDSAQPGDRLLLAPGATFTGNFRLTNKGAATTYITLRSAAADTLLPPDGVRILPSDAAHLPVIQSPNTAPALKASAGAHHWRLQYLEFRANDRGYGDIIALGAGNLTQTTLAQVPHNLVLDHLYIHGHPAIGQKRGIALHSGATRVADSYIADMKGVGMDTQAINGYNGPGPYTIVNNYLEGAGENFMLGGASPKIPNMIPADIEFTGNHLFKPLAWRAPILSAPTGVTAVGGGSGTLPAGTYSYRIVAARKTAHDAWAYSPRAAEVTVTVGIGGRVTVSWAPVAGATTYRVYRGPGAGAQDRYFGTAATSFIDDGAAAGIADTGAWATGTRWTVKNLFELKVGQRVRVHGNLMENCWKESQVGAAVLITPRNQDGTSPWIYVRDVAFTGNLVRHAGAGVQLEGYDSNATSLQTRRITFANNIFDDINSAVWGGNGRWIQIGSAPSDVTIDHNTVLHDGPAIFVYGGSYGAELAVANLRFTNNLVKHNSYGIVGDGRAYGSDTLSAYFPGATVQRNTFAGASASRYPAGNEFPTVAYWQGQFLNLLGSNFALIDSSAYRSSGTDALDLGAPVAEVEADALMARQGRAGAAPPVAISSTTLPPGRTGAAYATALVATGGSGAYVWTLTAGELPGGLSFAAATGVLSGTPLQPGTFPITIAARDAGDAANTASQVYALTIASTAPTISLASPVHGATLVGTGAALVASAGDPDGTVTRVDFYANATILGSASAAPWSIAWDHVPPGTYRLTAVATDNDGLTTTSAAADVTIVARGTTEVIEPVTPGSPAPAVTPTLPPGIPLPGTVQAEDFDDGGEGVGYHDTTGGNTGAVYRATDVDIEATRDRGRGHDVSWTTAGEWLKYTVTVAKPGTCVLTVRVASRGTGGTFHIEFDGHDKTGRLRIPNTGSRQRWVTVRKAVTLAAGTQVMRLVFDSNGRAGTVGSVNYIAVSPVPQDVVLYANDLTVRGSWTREADSTAAGGSKVVTPDLGLSRPRAPLRSPSGYVEAAFNAPAGTTYAIWLRLRATGNHKDNESVWVQFSDARSARGSRVYALRSTSGLLVNLEPCNGCGVSDWGWQKGASWLRQATSVTFAASGRHIIRVQVREDGAQIDQIVLSPSRYLRTPPGTARDDTTIVDKP
jgi:hypothetical protein